MDLWSIRIVVEDKFKELFSEFFENFDGYLSSSLFQDKDLSVRYDISKSYNLTTNKLGEFHQNEYWLLEVLLNKKPNKIVRISIDLHPWSPRAPRQHSTGVPERK